MDSKACLLFAVAALISVISTSAPGLPQSPEIDQDVVMLRATRSFDFGAFCISNIPAGQVSDVSAPDFTPEGVWRDVTITVSREAARKPRIFVFRDVRSKPGPFTGCRETLPAGVTRIIEGDVRFGKLEFRMLVRPNGDRAFAMQIDHDQMKLNLTGIRSNFDLLYGGKVIPDGSELRVTNVGQFVANQGLIGKVEDNILTGTLRVGSSRLKLAEALLVLPGSSEPLTVDFATRQGVALDVAVPTGALTLHKGTFQTGQVPFKSTPLRFAGISADDASGTIAMVALIGQEGRSEPHAEITEIRLRATQLVHDAIPYTRVVPSGHVDIAKISGLLNADRTSASISLPAASGLRTVKADLALGGSSDAPGIRGVGDLAVTQIDTNTIDGTVTMANPLFSERFVPLSDVVARSTQLKLSGPKDAAQLNGTTDLSRARLSTLDLRDTTNLTSKFSSTMGPGEIAVPFTIDTASPTGRWSITDPSGATVTLEGTLKRLAMAGTLYIAPSPPDSRIEVSAGSLDLRAEGAAVRRSIVFGVPAEKTEISTALGISSPAGFTVRRQGAEGNLHVAAELLVATEPQLVFDSPDGSAFVIEAPVRFETGATVSIDLASLKVGLVKGRASLNQLGAKSRDNSPARISDLEVTAAALSLESLAIVVSDSKGEVRGTGLEFAASRIRHLQDPVWDLDAPNPRIPAFQAKLGDVMTGIIVEDATVSDISFTAKKGRFQSRDGFVVEGQTVAISADRMTESSITNGKISIESGSLALHFAKPTSETTGSTTFAGFRVSATGTKNHLTGEGALVLDNLRVSHAFAIVEDKCGDRLRLRATAGLGRLAMNVRLVESALTGSALGGRAGFELTETGHDTCEWNEKYRVEVLEAVTKTVCWVPLIDRICKVVHDQTSVPVDVPVRWRAKIHQVRIPVQADSIEVALHGGNGVGVCVNNVKAKTLGKIQHASVTPTFEARGDLADAVKKAFQTVMELTAGVAQSAIVTLTGNLLGLFTEIAPADFCKG